MFGAMLGRERRRTPSPWEMETERRPRFHGAQPLQKALHLDRQTWRLPVLLENTLLQAMSRGAKDIVRKECL